jgi:hypothetical protein
MKKLTFLSGAILGFVLGSKVGPEPYALVEKKVRELANRPEVQDAVKKTKSTVHERAHQTGDKMPFGDPRGSIGGAHPPASTFEPVRS